MSPFGRAFRSALLVLLLLPQQAGAEALRHGQGLLWQVERGGKPAGQIFGTIHLTDPDIVALPAPVARAFETAASVSVEVILDQAAMQSLGGAMVLPEGRQLQDVVPRDVFEKAAAAAAPLGLPAPVLSRLKPWAVAMLISSPPAELQNRQAGHLPLDVWLSEAARAVGKPVHALETLAEQVGIFDTMSAADQVAHLRAAAIAQDEKLRVLAAMKAAYLRRDVDAILRIARQDEKPEDRAARETVERRLLDDRNRRMVERMLPQLDAGGAFIAIGAAHLPGELGVLALLEQRGYAVTRVY